MSIRKNKDEEIKGEWLATYSDVVTLLLTFFIFMFAISNVDAQKWAAVAEALGNTAINNKNLGTVVVNTVEPTPISTTPNPSKAVTPLGEITPKPIDFDNIYNLVKEYIEGNGLGDKIDINKTDDYIRIRFKDNIIFMPDSPVMTTQGRNILDFIGKGLFSVQDKIDTIRIEGHTADTTGNMEYNWFSWDLSENRAMNVLRFFIEIQELDPKKMSAAGYSKYHPIADNDSESGRAKNRRVEIIITKYKKH